MRKRISAIIAGGMTLGAIGACGGLIPMAGAGGPVPMDSTRAVAVAERNVCGRAMAPADTACVVTGYSYNRGRYTVRLDRHPPVGNDHLIVTLTENGQHVEVNQRP
jgi:hypothetical protein